MAQRACSNMNKARLQDGKIFYGWWVVVIAGIGLFMGYGAVISFTFGVFSNPLSQEFRWSRTEISLAYSLSLIVYCAATPVIGRLVDRLGARKVIVPSVLMFGFSLLSFHFLSGS